MHPSDKSVDALDSTAKAAAFVSPEEALKRNSKRSHDDSFSTLLPNTQAQKPAKRLCTGLHPSGKPVDASGSGSPESKPSACVVGTSPQDLSEDSRECVSKFSGEPVNILTKPFFIELFAGSARVTSFLQAFGLSDSFGVDHKIGKHSGKILIADLTTHEGQQLCREWLKSPNLAGIFAAPPCGTCSRARGIPIKMPDGSYKKGPQPLRSDEFPNGLRNLSWLNRAKVSSANKVYHFLSSVILEAVSRNLIVCIENPRRSLYWRTSYFRDLRKHLHFTAHQACCYGSQRPKWTALAHNTKALDMLNKTCPGVSTGHEHAPWGLTGTTAFATADETAYPPLLAFTIAHCLVTELVDRGHFSQIPLQLTTPDEVSYQYLRSVVGLQPKASKLPPLVSEFGEIRRILLPKACSPPVAPGESLKTPWHGLPAGACHLKKPPIRSSEGIAPEHRAFHFGIFRTPVEFCLEAAKVGHPIQKENCLPPALAEALSECEKADDSALNKRRIATLKFWVDKAKELDPEERALHEKLPEHVRHILKPKRLLLWKAMMDHYNYFDPNVFQEVTEGIELVGTAPFVKEFNPSFKPAKMTVDDLVRSAASVRKSVLHSTRSSGDSDLDEQIYKKTLEEVAEGWLSGPLQESCLPPNAVVSRRFGIVQSSASGRKVRLIDDFSASGVNSTVQVDSMAQLHTLDVVAAAVLQLLKDPSGRRWIGKTFDLSSAYRQLAVSPKSEWASHISVFNPTTKRPEIFAMRALPFGSSRSVYGFLRTVQSVWWIGCRALSIPWTSFYDDFVTFARTAEAHIVEVLLTQFFKLLGWQISEGEKNLPFAESFRALGVEISCERWADGVVEVGNTQQRRDELIESIDKILHDNELSQSNALRLRGRMQFAKAQLWSRSAKLCLSAVTDHAYRGKGVQLSDHCRLCLEMFKESLRCSKPRFISALWDSPMFVFTDACFQPENIEWPCGLGGVLCSTDGTPVSFFSVCLDISQLNLLGYPGKKTVIFEAELMALLLGVMLWSKALHGKPVVCYVDNNSARDVLISANARTATARALLEQALRLEDESGILAWYARVPSESNVADAPSRNELSSLDCAMISKSDVAVATDMVFLQLRSANGG